MSYFPPLDMMLEFAAGRVPNTSTVSKFGRNGDVDTANDEDCWTQGGTWVAPTTARTHQIVSTDTNDTNSSGTGARTVLIQGLDASWAAQQETITMNGTTNVPTGSTYLRIFRMIVVTAGSGQTNAGVITATADTDATVTAAIAATEGQTLMAIYTVPAGKKAFITCYYAAMNKQGATAGAMADVALFVRADSDTATPAWSNKHVMAVAIDGSSYFHHCFRPYFGTVAAKSDIKIIIRDVSKNNTDVSAGFDIILETA